jgi:hypothetical protein
MKYILIFGIIIQMIIYAYKNQTEHEPFYLFKSIIYFFVSCIDSFIICVKLPLGALLMAIICLVDRKNHSTKRRLIAGGVVIVILSSLNYQDISMPFQKLYLYNIQTNVSKIEVYTNNGITNKYLYSLVDKNDIVRWTDALKSSSPHSSWNYKIIPQNTGYVVKLYYPSKTMSIIVTPTTSNLPNLFIGKSLISYKNHLIPTLINSYLNIKPLSLIIASENIEITNDKIINDLWKEILWDKHIKMSPVNEDVFNIESKLILSENHEVSLNFSTDFTYLKINNKQVIELSEYLKNKLAEQYILSQLEEVSMLTEYQPVHIHTMPRSLNRYSIELDSTGRYYGLYTRSDIENTKVLLHNVSSYSSQYFVLKNPYLLLLDEKAPDQYYLMLINQNLPNKHRYVEKSKNIIPRSIALCPNNTKFTYTIRNHDSSSLYLVNNYYESPTVIATGNILDSLFLSERHIVFSVVADENNLLCIYDTSLSKTVKYISIPGNIHLIEVQNDSIIFSIQKKEKAQLKEGIFSLDSTLNIKRID